MSFRSHALAAAPLALALPLPDTAVRFAAAEGLELTKEFETKVELSVAGISATFDGEDPGMPDVTMATRWSRSVTVNDTYERVADGLPRTLARRFDTAEREFEFEFGVHGMGIEHDESGTAEVESPFSGATIEFRWDDDATEFEREVVDGEVESADLSRIVEDMDLRTLLPEESVSEGDEWEVDAEEFVELLRPGGMLELRGPVERAEGPMIRIVGVDSCVVPFGVMLGEGDGGDVMCTLKELGERAGERVAKITVDASVDVVADLKPYLEASLEDALPDDAKADIDTADLMLSLDLEGELVWSIENHHALTLELTGNITGTLERSTDGELMGNSARLDIAIELEGSIEHNVSIDR